MSIARWCDGDLYVYNSVAGFVCMDCPLLKRLRELGRVVPYNFVCQTLHELRAHVIEHKQAGDDVAESTLGTIARYIQEQAESNIMDSPSHDPIDWNEEEYAPPSKHMCEHWYRMHEEECVLCGAGGKWRERVYGPKPPKREDRYVLDQFVCGYHYL